MSDIPNPIAVSVVIVNYNCKVWVPRCLESLRLQTCIDRIEVIFVDNQSADGSDLDAGAELARWPNGVFLQTGANLGFGGGGNAGAKIARGKYLYFLNTDVWLEPDCIEELLRCAETQGHGVVGPTMLNYGDDSVQSRGVIGFDIFGFQVDPRKSDTDPRWFCCASFFFIRRELFDRIGGWDAIYFMYGEEMDISWRTWVSGETLSAAPRARIHHRGAAYDNPKGGEKLVELRTNDTKRFCTYRNHLLTLLKSAQHLLLLLLIPAGALMLIEGLAGALWLRRWSFFHNTSLRAFAAAWRLRKHWWAERTKIRSYRRRSDWWMLRFLSPRFNRWHEFRQILKYGMPKIEAR